MYAFLVTISLFSTGAAGYKVDVIGPYTQAVGNSALSVSACKRIQNPHMSIQPGVGSWCVKARSSSDAARRTLLKSSVSQIRRSTSCKRVPLSGLLGRHFPGTPDLHEYDCNLPPALRKLTSVPASEQAPTAVQQAFDPNSPAVEQQVRACIRSPEMANADDVYRKCLSRVRAATGANASK